ncbi:single-stranded DNA binding protein [Gottschalkia purinilytica]|uniref:Single-stranded DNA binding protein n=1 Tax=Gottschalkia purinilytica TaxID=1503 RepID=A0A0L0W7H7_GOTPU|nr:single-stranded DNA-binding protein [Gottschalkia purinilytica]KNF07459.1 single-stranded DNA binding protein [Gottschalkia purinilytica]
MTDKVIDTNMVTIVGKIASDKEFSHEMYGEGFYSFDLEVPRLSNHVDILPVTISERLLVDVNLKLGEYLVVEGQLRSYNRYVNGNNRLVLTIFARETYIPKDEEELNEILKRPNEIYLDGYICKEPVYRTTPFGREITDLLIAVNRPYNKSDYIPCIAWGRNARFCEKLEVGDHIKLWGRIQSREYQKKLTDGEVLNKVAFEVSVSKLEYLKDDNNREGKEFDDYKENSEDEEVQGVVI